jgi:hypothetical protein
MKKIACLILLSLFKQNSNNKKTSKIITNLLNFLTFYIENECALEAFVQISRMNINQYEVLSVARFT